MKDLETEHCPNCRRKLVGAIETASAEVAGIRFGVMDETPDRNWITCDVCSRTLCKDCCIVSDSGYCDHCFIKYRIEPYLPY